MKLMSRAVPATYFSITTIYIHFLFIKNAYSGCFFVSRDLCSNHQFFYELVFTVCYISDCNFNEHYDRIWHTQRKQLSFFILEIQVQYHILALISRHIKCQWTIYTPSTVLFSNNGLRYLSSTNKCCHTFIKINHLVHLKK